MLRHVSCVVLLACLRDVSAFVRPSVGRLPSLSRHRTAQASSQASSSVWKDEGALASPSLSTLSPVSQSSRLQMRPFWEHEEELWETHVPHFEELKRWKVNKHFRVSFLVTVLILPFSVSQIAFAQGFPGYNDVLFDFAGQDWTVNKLSKAFVLSVVLWGPVTQSLERFFFDDKGKKKNGSS
uniref:Transmembrane protein n=1 Tax=Chromera velia CCMP2878 TaxID=1169474 RepID=A0A0G4GL59_9ALVE|mmetsp:Transcript_20113/g.40377  ORF Transcript_20113/g.40377 Transcript_20113/m.40377 type:complete len:182 (-) Transcript_20113:317-862(-)|eukprot:Cvel_22403.t1-p1 / transcript=Cvel_22403.t1 / gene=Cvel_22403 / organism=Chromera_velia_CCMP2878 / gene_product=hypothetical protein / transcript_product=hypothetical protein / location=Cvel_scaffold2198:2820-5440(-) / protein_length=181 / sequence_SO=supercontig / SO=protein_coding / is_pseudo=false